MIPAYAIVKKAAALVNHKAGRLGDTQKDLIVRVCDETLEGQHRDQFPLHVWMTGSGIQFNMNVNEVIANQAIQLAARLEMRPPNPSSALKNTSGVRISATTPMRWTATKNRSRP